MTAETTNVYVSIEPEIKNQAESILFVSKMTEEELDAELEKGYQDMLAGRVRPAREVFADMRRDYGI